MIATTSIIYHERMVRFVLPNGFIYNIIITNKTLMNIMKKFYFQTSLVLVKAPLFHLISLL